MTFKFTMEDVNSAHAIKPYLPKKVFVKKFAYLNSKLRKGWSIDQVARLLEIMNKTHEDKCLN